MKNSLFFLKDFPLLGEIFEYDPTYREIMRKKVLTVGARVFKDKHSNTYYLFPCGLNEKLNDDEEYIIINFRVQEDWMMVSETIDWESFYATFVCIRYHYSRKEQRDAMREMVQDKHLWYMHDLCIDDFKRLYRYNFRMPLR
jgi:hypothetical protein